MSKMGPLFYQNSDSMNFGDAKIFINNEMQMPAVGFGTYRITQPDVLYSAINYALKAGYRLFDTAAVYRNEIYLGRALRELLPKYGLCRQDIFITSKLAPADYGKLHVPAALQRSLDNLGIEYLDMYLIHFPGTAGIRAEDPANQEIRHETWSAMVKLYEQGLVHGIGVSNFTLDHLEKIKQYSPVLPMLNQVEWHPYYHQPQLLKFCKENSIVLQAYCSFGGASKGQLQLLEEPIVKSIAEKHNIDKGQVLLLWALQQGIAVIPKATTPYHIRKNIDVGDKLTDEDIKALSSLEKNHKYAWDPSTIIF